MTSKFVFDWSDLTKAEKASAKAHGEFQSGAKASTTHTLRFSESLTTMMSHLGGMPPVANEAARGLESMSSTGVTGMNLLGGAAVAGLGLVVGVIGESIKKYTELADQTENYKRVVGGSAEESGRMVQTFQALGVGADTAAGAMFKLSKAVEIAPQKLEALGVVVAHDTAGNIDLSKTLLSVSDAYNKTSDQAKKNIIVFDAFGKTGKDMIPILEQGSVSLQNMERAAKLTFSDADLQAAKDYKIELAQLQQGVASVWEGVGQKLVPQLVNLMDQQKKTSGATGAMTDAMNAGTVSQLDYQLASLGVKNSARDVYDKFIADYDASHKVKAAFDEQAAATAALTAKNDELWTSLDKVVGREEAQVNAGLALQRADLAVAESAGKADKAAEAYSLTVKQFGANSDEATLAHQQYERVLIDQADAYYKGAAAARKLQEDTDLAATKQKDAKLEAEAYIAKLQEEADTLGPNNPLRKNLQAYIDKLKNEIPAAVTTKFITDYVTTGTRPGGHGNLSFAEGGRPPVGPVFTVGEKGPELMRLDSPATVFPHGQSASGGGADMSRVEQLLQESNALTRAQIELLHAIAAPSDGMGGTGVEAAIYRVVSMAQLNRMRGGAGA